MGFGKRSAKYKEGGRETKTLHAADAPVLVAAR